MRLYKKIILIILALICLLVLIVFFLLKQTLPRIQGEISLQGITNPITIKRNHWGVPLIEAQTRDDLFFAIGYLHASDRLFQMDLTRRHATGRLSEIFGDRTVETDRYHKDMLIEESIQTLLQGIPSEKIKILEKYCQGVNTFIKTRALPPEFTLLNYRPQDWGLKDMVSIFKNMELLLAESGSELYNAKIIESLGLEKAKQLIIGVHGSTIINAKEYQSIYRNNTLKTAFLNEKKLLESGIGSNNWVISGSKTSTGHPLLANDLHLPNTFPAYFYQIMARTDQFELSGNTLPGVPFIIVGRNSELGWGFTNTGTDVIDYFLLEINPRNPNQYKLDGKWEEFKIIKKRIKVKNKQDIIQEIRVSRFGPVFEDGGRYYARHSIMQYPSTTMDAFFKMNFAKDIDEFILGVKQFSSPAQNIVFADRKGNIGYIPAGLIPKRKRGTGEVPVPVSRSTDIWEGFYDQDDIPVLLNPEKGIIVTANNPVLPENHLPVFAKNWYPSFRADRINELLNTKSFFSLADNQQIQTDSFLNGARFLISQIRGLTFSSEKATFVLDQLKKWNYRADKGLAPFLFYTFEHQLSQNIFGNHIKDEKLRRNLISYTWIYRILNYPEAKSDADKLAYWMDDITTPEPEDFKHMVEKSLIDVYNQYQKESGNHDLSWEKSHILRLQHPLGSIPVIKGFLNRGPYFMPGGRGCILTASFKRATNFHITQMSTFRMIMDFSNFSNSLFINATGQSGHFMSPHYDDQIDLFINLKYRKMENFSENLKILRLIPGNHSSIDNEP
ncbi:MAG: penicillin acylase family protein [Candidatus Aminicenantes bacterium]|nr:penicillin acylase family protein [Candidatus Aminicenantes bacterium]